MYVEISIYRALLESQAGFFGAQMTAMDAATRNAKDDDRAANALVQPRAPGGDHQGADGDHRRRRGAEGVAPPRTCSADTGVTWVTGSVGLRVFARVGRVSRTRARPSCSTLSRNSMGARARRRRFGWVREKRANAKDHRVRARLARKFPANGLGHVLRPSRLDPELGP